MAAKEISVKKYVVRLSGEERERLETLIRKGKSPARQVLKARILLKADVSEADKGWSDNRIIEALETSPSMVYRVRKQLLEEGFEAVLSRKPRAMSAVARIFDGEREAKLIALACSKPPKGRARWTLRLLENKVLELGIVDRASDSTIGRTLKKTFSSPIAAARPRHQASAWTLRVVEIGELSGRKEVVAHIADGALDATLLVPACHRHRTRVIMIMCGERDQGGMKADGVALALQHCALEIVVEQDTRTSVPVRKGVDVTAQEVLHAGIE